jgi:hypothetical protein
VPGLKSVPRLRPVRGTLSGKCAAPLYLLLGAMSAVCQQLRRPNSNTLLSVFVSANPLLTSLNAEVCKLM